MLSENLFTFERRGQSFATYKTAYWHKGLLTVGVYLPVLNPRKIRKFVMVWKTYYSLLFNLHVFFKDKKNGVYAVFKIDHFGTFSERNELSCNFFSRTFAWASEQQKHLTRNKWLFCRRSRSELITTIQFKESWKTKEFLTYDGWSIVKMIISTLKEVN